MRPGHDTRITHLFRRGHSLDLVSELGLLYGWTRADARRVLAENGWALDWAGRLQPRFLKGALPGSGVLAAQADPERLLNAGIDHEDPVIRRIALNAERAIEKLRTALIHRENEDAHEAVTASLGLVLGTQDRQQSVRAS